MKNLYLLPTKKPSRLHLAYDKDYYLSVEPFIQLDTKNYKSFNLYITSAEEIKEGDWFYDQDGEVCKYTSDYKVNPNSWNDNKKIILTTDPDLIKDGVQAIDDEFLKWFVKNQRCEWVKVNYDKDVFPYGVKTSKVYGWYKIIIPKEEPKQDFKPTQGEKVWIKVFSNWSKGTYIGYDITKKTHLVREDEEGGGHLFSSSEILPYNSTPNDHKQETIEEATEREFPLMDTKWCRTGAVEEENFQLLGHRRSFIKGAKWQADRMYSEEDMINFAFDTYCYISGIMKVPFNKLSENKNHAKDNLEKFKKK